MVVAPKVNSPEEAALTFGTTVAEKEKIRHKDNRIKRVTFALVFKCFFSRLAICSHIQYKIDVIRLLNILFFEY